MAYIYCNFSAYLIPRNTKSMSMIWHCFQKVQLQYIPQKSYISQESFVIVGNKFDTAWFRAEYLTFFQNIVL